MSDDALIRKALDQIAIHEAAAAKLKRWVNDADMMLGNEPRFGDVADAASNGTSVPSNNGSAPKKYGPGEFFNKAFASAVKTIMADRYEANGKNPAPASVDAIHDHLLQGSFNFETTGADSQKNSIRISLGKNSVTFVKLPGSDLFGLVEWYGGKRSKPGRRATGATVSSPEAEVETDQDDTTDEYFTGEAQPDAETETATEGFRRRI